LLGLASKFDTPAAHVDTGVHNAARIARLPGTWNRKGVATPDRPHRVAKLLSVPDTFEVLPLEILDRIAGLKAKPSRNGHHEPFRARGAFTVPECPELESFAAWFRTVFEGEAGKVAMAPQGKRHLALRAATRTLAGHFHHGFLDETEVVSQLKDLGRRSGLPDKETDDAIAWGVENGKDNRWPWPEKLGPRPTVVIPGASTEPTQGSSGRTYAFPLIVRGNTVRPKKIGWLWPDRIPYGFLTLMAGRTGVGKSFVTLDLAARLTVGEEIPFYGGACFTRSNVLIISEDSHEYVLAPRMIEADADMSRVSFMSWEAMAAFTLTDVQMLDDMFEASGRPRLVVIDPPTNFLGARDEHKNAEVRSALMGVSVWSMRHDVACVMITHCNKGVKKDMAALDRIIGSVAWASTSRIAHIFAPDPDCPSSGLFLPLKSNIGQMPEGLSYEIEKTDTLARVNWTGTIDLSADDALSGEKKKPRGIAAVEWLTERFREKRDWTSDDLKAAAAAAGVSKNALWAPEVAALPIRKRPVTGDDGERHWHWEAMPGWPPL
jgi:hypothetical protein